MSGQDKPFAEWLGRTSVSDDVVTPRLADSFAAIFDGHLAQGKEGEAPLGIHWCLSPAIAPMAQLGSDGHPAKNLTLPPVPLPRRMWAGGELELFDPLRIGDEVRRTSTIEDIVHKQGRTGDLWFVAVGHQYETQRGLSVRERHDIVYREAADPSAPRKAPVPQAPEDASIVRSIETPPTLLFRYSAITFNGHRIHYDLPYATGVEGYDGLVVHGPIQATLLLNLASMRPGAGPPGRFSYRGLSPAIAGRTLSFKCGAGDRSNTLWTEGCDGVRHMSATVA